MGCGRTDQAVPGRALELRPDGDRCQPLGDSIGAGRHGPPEVLFNSYCYHGTVDESLIVATPDGPADRPGNVGAPSM